VSAVKDRWCRTVRSRPRQPEVPISLQPKSLRAASEIDLCKRLVGFDRGMPLHLISEEETECD
jgi:hypothetical protein